MVHNGSLAGPDCFNVPMVPALVQRYHTGLNGLSFCLPRFAHQFLDPGTYVFQDNGKPENIAVVLVKEEGAACGAGLSPVQPSSPYQLGRLGVLRHRMLTLGPDWAVITGTSSDTMAGRDQGSVMGPTGRVVI